MLTVNVVKDEELQRAVKPFISSLLPHANFSAEDYSVNLQYAFKYIHLEEYSMEYYILLKVCDDLNKIKSSVINYVPNLTRDKFIHILEVSLGDSILNPVLRVQEWLEYENLNSNLQLETVKEDACQKLYARCLELYDECFELAQDSRTTLDNLPMLKAAFVGHIANQTLTAQVNIIQGKFRLGRKVYSGYNDWLEFTSLMTSELSNRINDTEDESFCIDSLEKSQQLLRSIVEGQEPLAKFGIPEIDGVGDLIETPMLKHRLIVFVGGENIGKSMFAKDSAINAFLQGRRVLYMCGENEKGQIYSELLINYIYKKYNFFVTPSHLADVSLCPENIQKVINLAMVELYESGNLILRDSYSYDNLYNELVADYDKHHADIYFIDHTFSLTGGISGDNGKANIDKLSKDLQAFRKTYPVCVIALSHPSADAKDAIKHDKSIVTSPTRGSQNLSIDADDVYVFRSNEVLAKEGLLALENTKRRKASVLENRVILKKQFDVSHFIYDEKNQASSTTVSAEAEASLAALEELYNQDDADVYCLD